MTWLITIDSLLWIAAIVLFFAGFGWISLICAILGIALTLVISKGWIDLSDIFFFLD